MHNAYSAKCWLTQVKLDFIFLYFKSIFVFVTLPNMLSWAKSLWWNKLEFLNKCYYYYFYFLRFIGIQMKRYFHNSCVLICILIWLIYSKPENSLSWLVIESVPIILMSYTKLFHEPIVWNRYMYYKERDSKSLLNQYIINLTSSKNHKTSSH